MHLFSEQGFKATTIVQIEAAAGLTPGAGGIYHHFPNKETLLTAGVQRHLQRLDALRDLRRIFSDLGDLRTELTITARYILAELDRESELLRILATEAHNHPKLLQDAREQLVGSTLHSFAIWLTEHSQRPITNEQAQAIASLALGGLIATRLLQSALATPVAVDDELLIDTWVNLLQPALQATE
jgi:AcrR family transcriptional regulator